MLHAVKNQSPFSRIDQYTESGLKDAIVDPDPDLTYTKRKIAKEQANSGKDTVPQIQGKIKVNFPTTGWGSPHVIIL